MSEGVCEEAVGMNDDLRRPLPDYDAMTLEELARLQGVHPVQSLDELAVDFFESDEEMEEFIAYTYAARRRDMV